MGFLKVCEKHDHCVITYDSDSCPLCEAEVEINKYLGDIDDLNQDIVSLKDQNTEYENQIESLKTELDAIIKEPEQGGE